MRAFIYHDYFLLTIFIVSNVILVHCEPGPGTIYYRKPTKLVFYKKFPPVLIYPKRTDDEFSSKSNNDHQDSSSYEKNGADIDHDHDLMPQSGHIGHSYYTSPNHIDNQLVKYGQSDKYFLLNPNFLEHLIQSEEKFYVREVEKKPKYDNWLTWLFGIESHKEKFLHNHNFELGSAMSYAHFADTKFHNEPVYTYHPKKPLNIVPIEHQHHEHGDNIHHLQHVDSIPHIHHQHDDVKPVVEHIEGDIKYDFRTKTHSYDR